MKKLKNVYNKYCLIDIFNMKELNEWKEQISHDEYNSMIEFINMTKNKQKIHNKFLFLYGNIQKSVKLVIDIENTIDIDDCEYIQFDEFYETCKGYDGHLDDFLEDKGDEDLDEETLNIVYKYEICMNKIENKKCLIIENNMIYDEKLGSAYGIIKSIVGNDNFLSFDIIKDTLNQYVPNFNIIFLSPVLPEESSMLKRAIIINLK